MPPGRSPLGDLFAALETAFRRLDCRWYLFGAQAALLYGAARLTADVDVTVEIGDSDLDSRGEVDWDGSRAKHAKERKG